MINKNILYISVCQRSLFLIFWNNILFAYYTYVHVFPRVFHHEAVATIKRKRLSINSRGDEGVMARTIPENRLLDGHRLNIYGDLKFRPGPFSFDKATQLSEYLRLRQFRIYVKAVWVIVFPLKTEIAKPGRPARGGSKSGHSFFLSSQHSARLRTGMKFVWTKFKLPLYSNPILEPRPSPTFALIDLISPLITKVICSCFKRPGNWILYLFPNDSSFAPAKC